MLETEERIDPFFMMCFIASFAIFCFWMGRKSVLDQMLMLVPSKDSVGRERPHG